MTLNVERGELAGLPVGVPVRQQFKLAVVLVSGTRRLPSSFSDRRYRSALGPSRPGKHRFNRAA
jgi:hypothetical protein